MPLLSYQDIATQIPSPGAKVYLGYSGGIDSHVLLHLCATQTSWRQRIVAVYIDHGLQDAAASWGTHCQLQARQLGVAFLDIKVNAHATGGESPEAAARQARYQAFQGLLKEGDLLLLAQHREDQMETLLLQLFRGAGIKGLAAMPVAIPFGAGQMLRPLLDIGKQTIIDYATHHALSWVDDPSNASPDFDRNFLRNAVTPLLKQRWPTLDKTVTRSASHCAAALNLIDDWAKPALAELIDANRHSLALAPLRSLSPEQVRWLLREWLMQSGLRPPSQALLQSIEQQLLRAHTGSTNPQIFTQGHYLKRYRQQLYCLPPSALNKITTVSPWPNDRTDLTLANGYNLALVETSSGISQQVWRQARISVRPREGGERLALPGRQGHHCLKKLYQEAGIPPWERDSRPLIYLNDRLTAVAGLWLDAWAWSAGPEPCYQLAWHAHDPITNLANAHQRET